MSVEEINQKDFEEKVLKNNHIAIVDFYAPWCGPCHMQSPIMDELAKEVGSDVNVYKVNVDNNQELASKYGVQSIPTIKIFKNGENVKTFVGLQDKSSLLLAINAA